MCAREVGVGGCTVRVTSTLLPSVFYADCYHSRYSERLDLALEERLVPALERAVLVEESARVRMPRGSNLLDQ